MFEGILHLIRSYDIIILHRHNRPDGDAMGSQVGLKYLLLENYPEKTVYMVGDAPNNYSFIQGAVMDDIPADAYENALAIILDCGGKGLISDDRYTLAAQTARIDHHLFCEKIAAEEVIDSSFESCCGLIAQLAMEAGWKLPVIAAKALYTGMVTDSGRFRYDSTSARTFRLAAFLMDAGFDTNEIFRNLYADTYESKVRKAEFTLKIRFTPNRVAYVYTTREELTQMEMDTFAVSRGMVNVMSDIQGTGIWVNFTETDNGVQCELRSSDRNINPIAVKYGGGGHAKASGATVADRETAMAMLQDLNDMIGENQ